VKITLGGEGHRHDTVMVLPRQAAARWLRDTRRMRWDARRGSGGPGASSPGPP